MSACGGLCRDYRAKMAPLWRHDIKSKEDTPSVCYFRYVRLIAQNMRSQPLQSERLSQ